MAPQPALSIGQRSKRTNPDIIEWSKPFPQAPPLTDYNCVVISNKQFAVNVDELCD